MSILCCCRNSTNRSYDLNDPNTVTVLPTEPGKSQPVPSTEEDTASGNGPSNPHQDPVSPKPHQDPVPPESGAALAESDSARQKKEEATSVEEITIIEAVKELDIILDNEEVNFFDCIENEVNEPVSSPKSE